MKKLAEVSKNLQKLASLEARKKKRNVAAGCKVHGNPAQGDKTKRWTLSDSIAKGYARKSAMTATPGKTWYLSHHGVYHPNKPGKIRVVFDLSVEHKGTCLNK